MHVPITYGSIRFRDSFVFVNERLDALVKNLKDEDFVTTRKAIGDKWQLVQQTLADPQEEIKET